MLSIMPLLVAAQSRDTLSRWVPEGFAEAGLANELWIVGNTEKNGYSTFTYRGKGVYAGAGLRTRTTAHEPFGYGLSINYCAYTMGGSLRINERAQTRYGFFRVSPAVYLLLYEARGLRFHAAGLVSYMVPILNNERAYGQVGLRAIGEYKAYEATLGFNSGFNRRGPATDVNTNRWHEQQFTIGVAIYPGRLLPKPVFIPNAHPRSSRETDLKR